MIHFAMAGKKSQVSLEAILSELLVLKKSIEIALPAYIYLVSPYV